MILFEQLEIETAAACNRKCPTCLRNSYPDRERVASWFSGDTLPTETVYRVIDEAVALGFGGEVYLQHFNEPLLDPRILDFGAYARGKGLEVGMCTNGDALTPDMVRRIDGVFSRLDVALYTDAGHDQAAQAERALALMQSFTKTAFWYTGGEHVTSHFSPRADRVALIERYEGTPCFLPWERAIIDHRGWMLLCCEDMPGHFNLGNVLDYPIEELWWGAEHLDILETLAQPGGRLYFNHCATCPRQGGVRPKAMRDERGTR